MQSDARSKTRDDERTRVVREAGRRGLISGLASVLTGLRPPRPYQSRFRLPDSYARGAAGDMERLRGDMDRVIQSMPPRSPRP